MEDASDTSYIAGRDAETPLALWQDAGLSLRQNQQLSVIEDHLEKEGLQETSGRPKSKIKRFRKAGKHLLHSKAVLMTVVILNSLDCTLVLSELILDVYFLKGSIDSTEYVLETFNSILKKVYPNQFSDIPVHDIHAFYNKILGAQLVWNRHSSNTSSGEGCGRYRTDNMVARMSPPSIQTRGMLPTYTFQATDDPAFLDEISDSIEEELGHAFHKTSIAILSILVLYTVFKVFCYGLAFVKHKLEVFDGVIILASFTLDICYIRGLTNYPAESFILILTIMIPWRVIRVLNSLVIAVKDNYDFLLKRMYKKNKNQLQKIQDLENQNVRKQKMVDTLLQVCKSNGLSGTQDDGCWLDAAEKSNTANIELTQTLGSCFGLLKREDSFDVDENVGIQLEHIKHQNSLDISNNTFANK